MKTNALQSLRARQSGSVSLAALGIIGLTTLVVGYALFEARDRFRTSHHSGRWAQAANAAEAGVELTLMTAQKDRPKDNFNSWVADGWTSRPGPSPAPAVTKTFALSTGVPATGPINATVSVDRISMPGAPGAEWLRVRSKGDADIAGGAVAGADAQDVLLRKLSLRRDRTTGANVATPLASRTVEILAAPKPWLAFKHSFVSKQLFDIHANTTSDSYDSSDPNKSNFTPFATYGIYDAAKRQSNGDVGTIDTLNTWNLNDARIWGDVLSPTGNVDNIANVYGTVTNDFSFTIRDEIAPTWTTVTQNHGVVSNVSKTLTGGTAASPTRHKFTSIELTSSNRNITVQNPAGTTESWVEIWVTGDVTIANVGATGIRIDPGVHATIHFGSKVTIEGGSGYGLANGSKLPANLIIRAYGGSSGAPNDFMIKDFDFWGVVSAPWYKVKFDMSGEHAHGSFLSWQFDCSDGTNLHYDEALANLPLGTGPEWLVKSWVEAVR